MKQVAFIFITLFMTACAATIADPWKVRETSAGKIHTDDQGMALYTFDKDETNKSNCYDKCATSWPPFLASAEAEPKGKWTVVERDDGTRMWAYGGRPLYTFAKDENPGAVTGDGVGGVWHVSVAAAEKRTTYGLEKNSSY